MFSRRTDFDLRPNDLTLQYRTLQAQGRDILDLTLSNPTKAGFLFPAESFCRALSREASRIYEPRPFGLEHARRTVASLYRLRGYEVDPSDLLLTSGTSEAYSFLFRLLADPGEVILVPRPSYPLFQYLCALDGVVPVTYPSAYADEWCCDLDHLEALVNHHRPKAILLVHPNNPTGSYTKAAEWERFEAIATNSGAALICDEVFFDYVLGRDPVSDPLRITRTPLFVLNGISKLLALPQVKLSWILLAGPEPARETARSRLELIADTFLSVSAMAQHALPFLMERREIVLGEIRGRLLENLFELERQTRDSLVQALKVEGGWYAVLRVPASRTDDSWASLILDAGVYLHPGRLFGFDRAGFLVISLLPPPDSFRSGIETILRVVEEMA